MSTYLNYVAVSPTIPSDCQRYGPKYSGLLGSSSSPWPLPRWFCSPDWLCPRSSLLALGFPLMFCPSSSRPVEPLAKSDWRWLQVADPTSGNRIKLGDENCCDFLSLAALRNRSASTASPSHLSCPRSHGGSSASIAGSSYSICCV